MSTPPHHPTHNVHFSPETIRAIVSTAFPEHTLANVETLPSGKSFNNRIYFIDISSTDDRLAGQRDRNAEGAVSKQRLVLKVSGQFFGPDKVQNEVSCLTLLEKYSPDIPAPRVIAWSEEGITMHLSSARNIPDKPTDAGGRGWILMTRRPGRLLSVQDMQGQHGVNIMQRLAGIMAQWRQQMPTADRIGNTKFAEENNGDQEDHILAFLQDRSLKIKVEGLLNCHHVSKAPITSSLDYYRIKLEDQLTKLETEEVFSAAREQVSPLVRRFINFLPEMTLFSHDRSTAITFTHYDFSPRNILVSESSPPAVTGILDFEFAGFFPSEEEFTNNAIANADDWPEQPYNAFLDELERLGVPTPGRGIGQDLWREASVLVKVTDDVAPWYLREGGIKGPELEAELHAAADRVKTGLSSLGVEAEEMRVDGTH